MQSSDTRFVLLLVNSKIAIRWQTYIDVIGDLLAKTRYILISKIKLKVQVHLACVVAPSNVNQRHFPPVFFLNRSALSHLLEKLVQHGLAENKDFIRFYFFPLCYYLHCVLQKLDFLRPLSSPGSSLNLNAHLPHVEKNQVRCQIFLSMFVVYVLLHCVTLCSTVVTCVKLY